MKKYDNFCKALKNLHEIHLFYEPYNNVAHAYNEAIALDIVRRTREEYETMFVELQKTLEDRIS